MNSGPAPVAPKRRSAAPVMILAGGTGGHIYPGLAVAKALQRHGMAVQWMGAVGAMEEKIVPKHHIPLSTISIRGLRGKDWKTQMTAPIRLLSAIWAASKVLKRNRPCAVISFGGFAAAPGGLAARWLKLPLLVHEQNRVAGLTNKILARVANRVLTGFPDSFINEEVVGNPIRQEIARIPPLSARLSDKGPLRLLVLGGSQGALALNLAVPAACAAIEQLDLAIWHQSGEKGFEQTEAAYRSARINARVMPFIQDMVSAFTWADLVICRAGASTLAEICAVGIGSILVPFAAAVDDHQTHNAQYLVAAGAAVMLKQSAGLAQQLKETLVGLINHPAQRLQMATAARSLAKPNAAEDIATIVLQESQKPPTSLPRRLGSEQPSAKRDDVTSKDRQVSAVLSLPINQGGTS